MKVTVIECDRCSASVRREDQKPRETVVRMRAADTENVRRELCPTCGDALKKFLSGAPATEPASRNLDSALLEEVQRIRTLAAERLELFAAGGTAEDLAQGLRDVATKAKRLPVP